MHRVALLIAMTLLAGCSGASDGRLQVTGNVTFDGEPLPEGYVTLQPLGSGPSAGARIEHGRFTVASKRGPLAGKYQVSIVAHRETGKMISTDPSFPEETTAETVQYLPARYNEQSELTAEISPENTSFDWALTSD